jgi:hypothetical protein
MERRRKNVSTIMYVPTALRRNNTIWQHTNINAKTTGNRFAQMAGNKA